MHNIIIMIFFVFHDLKLCMYACISAHIMTMYTYVHAYIDTYNSNVPLFYLSKRTHAIPMHMHAHIYIRAHAHIIRKCRRTYSLVYIAYVASLSFL